MARLLLFQNEDFDGEYVIIQEDMETPVDDFAEPGYTLAATLEIEGDPYKFPTDRSLRAS